MNDQNTNNKQETEVKILADTTEKLEQHEENSETAETKVSPVERAQTEAKILADILEVEGNKFCTNIESKTKEFTKELERLKGLNVMLQSTPTKFAAKLEESIPNIVEKLKGVILDQVHLIKTTNTQELAKRDKFIADMEGQFREITEKAAKFDKKRIAMFFLSLTLSAVISACGATYAASYMMKSFPTRVAIQHPENIILYDSNVSLWDLSESNAKLNDSHKKFNKLKEDLEKIEKQIQNKKLRKNNTKDSTKP
jgi:hypothetical protein